MENRPSKKNGKRGEKLKDFTPSIPPESPLGRMLRDWGPEGMSCTQGNVKREMMQYCMFEWTKEPIGSNPLYWLKYGSSEDWICQALNQYKHQENF